MKWVNLADREPIPNGKPIIVKIYDGDNILDVFWVNNHMHLVEDWNRYEWLDESEEHKTGIVNTWFTLVLIPFLSLKGVRLDDELRTIWKQLTKSLEQ